jgi:DNA-binding NtrC family response regulator
MMKGSILVVDDSKGIQESLELLLSDRFSIIQCISNPEEIPDRIRSSDINVVLLDMNFSAGVNTGNEGLYWLNYIKSANSDIQVILLTAYGNIDLAVEGMKRGAHDFVVKPWSNERLLSALSSALEAKGKKAKIKGLSTLELKNREVDADIIQPVSKVMTDLYQQVGKIASTDVNVLILGESGTGKEILARYLHSVSKRREKNFVSVDLGTIGESVFETEMFGHKRGAFTDAKDNRIGRVKRASGGTLFLDEIGNIKLTLQTKLLTLLQNKTITPVGADQEELVDIRLITATNRDLERDIGQRTFRDDLYYRISTIQFTIPPLRERKADIEHFALYFLDLFAKKYDKNIVPLDNSSLEKLREYRWPGNIRELKHNMERAVLLSGDHGQISLDLLVPQRDFHSISLDRSSLEEVEKETIMIALDNNGNNISQTAKALGITRQTLYAKIEKYGLQ